MRERGLLFAELVQGVGEAIPKHTHHAAFYHLTLAGGYEESTAQGMRSFPPFSSAFIAGDTRHFARVGNAGVHLFTMEMDSRWIQELREAGGELENTDDSIGGVLTCVGLRVQSRRRSECAYGRLARVGVSGSGGEDAAREMHEATRLVAQDR
jgi:hypothetical protein